MTSSFHLGAMSPGQCHSCHTRTRSLRERCSGSITGEKNKVTLGKECFPFFGSQRCQRKQSDVEGPEKNSFLADVAHAQRGHLESYQWLKNKCSMEAAIQRYPVSESCEGCKQEETGMTFPPPRPHSHFFFSFFMLLAVNHWNFCIQMIVLH